MGAKSQADDEYTDEEAQARFEATLKGALRTAPKPLKSMTPKRAAAQSKKPNKAKAKGDV